MIYRRDEMYIYLITNNINHKKYVGITNNYKKRWGNECSYPKDEKRRQAIQEAIHKYGKENFTFELLHKGLGLEEACKKEEELIKQYHSLTTENGYNVDKGGKYHPISKPQLGEKNGRAKVTDEEAQYILNNRNKPLYVLYEEFNSLISYEEFKQIYHNKKFKHLTTSVSIYPFNFEFSCQFNGSPLDYGDIVYLREQYNKGIYWKDVYQEYKDIYSDEWTFWNIYVGNRFQLVMPEVFTEKNKKLHSKLGKSGARNGRAKLTEDDVKNIRKLHSKGKTNKELYALYPQVTTTSIRDIINNKTWKNIL